LSSVADRGPAVIASIRLGYRVALDLESLRPTPRLNAGARWSPFDPELVDASNLDRVFKNRGEQRARPIVRAELVRIPSRSELLTLPAPLDLVYPKPGELMIVRTVFRRFIVEN